MLAVANLAARRPVVQRDRWDRWCKPRGAPSAAETPTIAIDSENVRRQFRQFGALALLQFDVGGHGLVAEPAHDVVEAV